MLHRLGVDLEDQTSEQDAEFMMEVCPPRFPVQGYLAHKKTPTLLGPL